MRSGFRCLSWFDLRSQREAEQVPVLGTQLLPAALIGGGDEAFCVTLPALGSLWYPGTIGRSLQSWYNVPPGR
jgi:hypothetical protein